MRIVGVFGSKKSNREIVLVRLRVGEIDIDKKTAEHDFQGEVVYASNPAFRGLEHWWVVSLNVEEGDVVRLETTVLIPRKGQDTDRTTTHYYEADPDVKVVEVRVPRCGPKKFPLLKGSLRRISQTSAQDIVDQKVEGMLSDVEE